MRHSLAQNSHFPARQAQPWIAIPPSRCPRLLVAGLALMLTMPACANEQDEAKLREELASLRARLEELEARLDRDVPPSPAAAVPAVELGKRGLAIRDSANGFELKVRGGLQLDHRNFLGGDRAGADGSFTFRRIRPTVEGGLGSLAAFRITPELAGDNVTLLDAWIDLNLSPGLALRFGRMKGPVGLERLVSYRAMPMIERGFASELAPNRALGVQAFGAFSSGKVQYAVGLFNGGPDGRNDASSDGDDNAELQGRVFFEPWRGGAGPLAGLGFGIAGTIGDQEGGGNAFLPRYRTPGQEVFFAHRSHAVVHGEHARWSPQWYWYHDRFGLLGEYIVSRQRVGLAGDPASARQLSHSAWSVTGSWSLTGEAAAYRGLAEPKDAFGSTTGGWGAFELAARLGELDVDDAAFPLLANPDSAASRARSWGVGLNWYLNRNVKVQFDHQHTRFVGGAPGGADRADERTFFSRLQLAF